MWRNNRKKRLQAEAERDEALKALKMAQEALEMAQEALIEMEEKYQYVLMLWGKTMNTSNELADRFDELRKTHRQYLEHGGRLHSN